MASPGKKAYPLRIDPALWDALEKLAATELRSVNGQIEYLLRDALSRRGIDVATTKRKRGTRADDGQDSSTPDEPAA